LLDVRNLPRRELSGKTLGSLQEVIGMVTVKDIGTGAPVTRDSVSQKYRLSQIVKPSMRAVTVSIDPIIGVGGFLKAGDRVDVIATFNVNNGTITKTVLQDVELIAIGPEAIEEEETVDPNTGRNGARPKPQTNATLAVFPSDAEKLVLAESKGRLRLSLRRPDDRSYVATPGVTGRGVLGIVPSDVPEKRQPVVRVSSGGPRPTPLMMQQPIMPLPAAAQGKTVQVVRGTQVEDTPVPE
jgi:pilus assembly protein CpaB